MFEGLGTMAREQQVKTQPEQPVVHTNKIATRVKNGKVAVDALINDEETPYYAAPYYKGEKASNSIPNIINAICDLMETIAADTSMHTQRTIIAVPNTVYYIANNLELLTNMIWEHRFLLDKKKGEDNKPRIMADKEYKLYCRLRDLICQTCAFIVIQDSAYTKYKKTDAITQDQQEWVKLNQTCYGMLHDTTPDDEGEEDYTPEDEELA